MKGTRIFTALAATALTITSLAACSTSDEGGESGSTSDSKETTVNWWTWDERQAASYKKCVPSFEETNPGIKVKISQYGVDDYFTKLTTGFVSDTAPDAFQNSVPLLGEYAAQGQIMALDDLIADTGYDLSIFDIGVDSWKYTDGKQYGIPLDWAGAAFYFNKDMVKEAGLTDEDIMTMTWNPDDGGTFDKIVARLTIDENGVRGDEDGFDPKKVETYGIGTLTAPDFNGQTSWNAFVSTLGWRMGGEVTAWPTEILYADKDFVKTLDYIRDLGDRGFMPAFGQFSVSGSEQIGSGSVAMIEGGTWDVTPLANVPDIEVGVAPTIEGPEGRMMISNSNANNIFAGTKHLDETWKWVTHMGSVECQTIAGADGTFLPSIAEAMEASVTSQAENGVDVSTFVDAMNNGWLYPSPPTVNGQELTDTMKAQFEAYFTGEKDSSIFQEMQDQTKEILAQQ